MDIETLKGKLSAVFAAALFVSGNAGTSCLAESPLHLPRVVVDQGGPYRSSNFTVQKYYDAIQIPAGYLAQPLSMVCTNGSETAPGFYWVRVFLLPDKTDQDFEQSSQPCGRLLVTEDSFLSTSQIYLNLTGQCKPGRNNICIEAAGKPGAVYSWEIRSIGNPTLYLAPGCSTTSGGWLNIEGAGFSLRPDENIVQLGPVKLPVKEASSRSLRVFVPKDFPAGPYDLCVSIRSFHSNIVKMQVLAPKSDNP